MTAQPEPGSAWGPFRHAAFAAMWRLAVVDDLTHQQIAVLTDLPVPARQFATRAPGRPTMGFVEPLVTDRLVLRPWLVEDAAEALGIYGHPDVARWLSPEMDHVPELAVMRLLLQQWVAEDDRTPPPAARWAIDRRDDGRLLGGAILLPLPPGREDLEVGWQLHPQAWGHGYASETTRALAGWAFRHDVDEIFAVVRPGNTRAAATVRRNGMEWVGETGKYFGLDLQVFRLRRADFDPAAATSPMPPNPPPSD